MILFNFAWNQAPGFGWEQPYVYALLIVGILLFPLFFWIELKISKHPLIPFDALSTDVTFVMICEMCGWAAFGTSRMSITSKLLTAIRDFYILLHPNSPTTPRNITASHNGSAMSRHYIWIYRCDHYWPRNFSDWARLGDAHFHVCVHYWQYNCCDYASAPNLLGTNVCCHAHYSLGYGHELSSWHAHHE